MLKKLARAYWLALIFLPLPAYLNAKTAGTFLSRYFADTSVATFAGMSLAWEVWEYYARFVASQTGLWQSAGKGWKSRYYWQPKEGSYIEWRHEVRGDWQKSPVKIGRKSLWHAFYRLTELDRILAAHPETRRDWIGIVGQMIKLEPKPVPVAAPPPPPQTEPEDNFDEEAAAAFAVPGIDANKRPANVTYNWKRLAGDDQYAYKKSGWKAVPAKRHPELKAFAVGNAIIWHGMILMEISSDKHKELVREDYDKAMRCSPDPIKRASFGGMDEDMFFRGYEGIAAIRKNTKG